MSLLGAFTTPTPGFSVGNPPPNPFGAAAAPRTALARCVRSPITASHFSRPLGSAFGAPAASGAAGTPSIFGSAAFGTPAATAAPAAAPTSSIFGAMTPFPAPAAPASAFPTSGLTSFNPLGTAGLPAFGAGATPAFGASAPGLLFANNAGTCSLNQPASPRELTRPPSGRCIVGNGSAHDARAVGTGD